MYIKELEDENVPDHCNDKPVLDVSKKVVLRSSFKKVFIGAGARVLFYPTLLYNIFRNKIQSEFRWWDEVDKFVLLGAVPFPRDVPCLKQLGVQGVITLNEPYETLVPTSVYQINGIDHLKIPTRDYLFAPSFSDIHQAVDFIHRNASCGKMTYVHCKAGRGRSTTVVLCYLVQHKHMTPRQAYEHVQSIRPRVLLASCQWKAVRDYYKMVMETRNADEQPRIPPPENSLQLVPNFTFDRATLVDDGSMVLVTEFDLDGYNDSNGGAEGLVRNDKHTDVSFVHRVQFAGQAALARLSCMWLRSHSRVKVASRKVGLVQAGGVKGMEGSCTGGGASDKLSGRSVDIPVF